MLACWKTKFCCSRSRAEKRETFLGGEQAHVSIFTAEVHGFARASGMTLLRKDHSNVTFATCFSKLERQG